MKRIVFLMISVILLGGCAVQRYRSDFAFATRLAREGLWQETIFRLEQARAAGNDTAALHNNLAVALESLGRSEEAGREYEAALKRAPGQAQILSNIEKFKKKTGKVADEKK